MDVAKKNNQSHVNPQIVLNSDSFYKHITTADPPVNLPLMQLVHTSVLRAQGL